MTDIFTFPQNISDVTDWIKTADSFTDVGQGGVLGILILLIIGVVMFFMTRSYGTERAFSVSTFVVAFLSIFLKIFGIINNYVLGACILFGLLGFYLMLKDAGQFD